MLSAVRITAVLLAMIAQQASAYWCAMHPDQRAPAPALCPVCRMAMVPIPPMRVGEYRMDVVPIAVPAGPADQRRAGLAGVRVAVRDPSGGAIVKAFDTVHEKPFHLFLVGRDLEFFRHLHPAALENGFMEARTDIPPGEFLVVADFLPAGGTPQLLQRTLISPGSRKGGPGAAATESTVTIPGGIRAHAISGALPAGQTATLQVVLTRVEDGRPVVDPDPFLGAAAHLLTVSQDLTEAIHAHAPLPDLSASLLQFEMILPKPGNYVSWVQFQWRGTVYTARLALRAR
jgi:hypothetical protein